MNYQVTCVCGHRFFVSDASVNRHIACPNCSRALIPLASAPDGAAGPAEAPVAAQPATPMEATKRCAFCGEVILAVAKKCRFCGEFLDRAAPKAAEEPAAGANGTSSTPAGTTETAAAKPGETPAVFSLSVSQWDNFWKFLICITIALVVGAVVNVFPVPHAPVITLGTVAIMVVLMYFFYLAAHNARCVIRPSRIETETGIFSKQIDTLDLWRIIDIDLKQSFIERILGIGTIFLKTTDESTPLLELYQIPKARKVYKYLQEQVPKMAKERGVVYVEK